MKILVTGAAGFIGSHLVHHLVARGDEVFGLDSINDYYDVRLKYGRLNKQGIDIQSINYGKILFSNIYPNLGFIKLKLEDNDRLNRLFDEQSFDAVCNLAAQAGVRYSLTNPEAYINANIVGFINILEACRHNDVKNLSYASSSSVYGLNSDLPFSTDHNVDHPISLYAASKKSNELMAHTYSHLYNIRTTGLRFFTVYGPWGRPDMALFKFVKAAVDGENIDVFNKGDMVRDFTYIDDIINGVIKVIDKPAIGNRQWTGEASSSSAPYKVYNIGNNNPVKLMDFIKEIEKKLGTKVKKNMMEMQPGDVPQTYACVEDLVEDMNYRPSTTIADGISKFVDWYLDFYNG